MHDRLGARHAPRLTATVFGVLSGLGGLTHGVGEVLQGNVPTPALWIHSWAQGPIAERMGGEPGITLLPTVLLAGVGTLLVSGAVLVWSVVCVQRRHGGRVLMALAVLMLLAGGGVGPPLIGLLAGLALPGGGGAERTAGESPGVVGRALAALWPGAFAVTAANGVFLVVGSVVLVGLVDVGQAEWFLGSFYALLPMLLVTVASARARGRIGAG